MKRSEDFKKRRGGFGLVEFVGSVGIIFRMISLVLLREQKSITAASRNHG